MVDAAPEAKEYCTSGYFGYLDVIFPGKHIYNIHNKGDTFTTEGASADLRHLTAHLDTPRLFSPFAKAANSAIF